MNSEALVVSLALGLAAGAWLFYRAVKLRRSFVARRRTALAVEGELRGGQLLKAHGFGIVSVQPRHSYRMHVDNEPRQIQVRADYLVSKAGRYWVADVKTGKEAPSIVNRNTRRQLLEYRLAYDVCGVLLVDMTNGRIRQIEFDFDMEASTHLVWRWVAMALLAITVLVGFEYWAR